jgi:hypothetical protein
MDGNVEYRVECYSGHEYAERPLAFFWKGQRYEVERVLHSAMTPEGKTFRVEVRDGKIFSLSYYQQQDCWIIQPG